MPRNGSGTYALPQAAFVTGTTIDPSAVNSDMSDIAAQITNSVAADGQTPMTGALNMNSHAITGVTSLTASATVSALSLVMNSMTLPSLLRGYIDGLIMTRASATTLQVAAGVATDSTAAAFIQLSSAMTKSVAGAWAAGTGNNGMGTALTVANTTWYHVFGIINAGAADVYFDTSISAANKPAGTTYFRRIGSFLTNGSAQIVSFIQTGDQFLWSAPVLSLDTSSLDTTPVYATMAVPTGVTVVAQANGAVSNASTSTIVLVHSPLLPDQAAYVPEGNGQFSTLIATNAAGSVSVPTDTSGRLRVVAFAANTVLKLVTTGWIDRRGKE